MDAYEQRMGRIFSMSTSMFHENLRDLVLLIDRAESLEEKTAYRRVQDMLERGLESTHRAIAEYRQQRPAVELFPSRDWAASRSARQLNRAERLELFTKVCARVSKTASWIRSTDQNYRADRYPEAWADVSAGRTHLALHGPNPRLARALNPLEDFFSLDRSGVSNS